MERAEKVGLIGPWPFRKVVRLKKRMSAFICPTRLFLKTYVRLCAWPYKSVIHNIVSRVIPLSPPSTLVEDA